ncbi:MlaA family lipoprotein [Halodesulfovibrio marinisediminis]|uniref:Phospholipid-binding lipoprotein MlaA n=1 Tax=Halodesulfovibrio marinisediminis DSM 17456 TaxID=1121457 RepID=A0A1N6DE27_9BACT|nr:VacJ family lipoprotein [Halodesulfovibrio marinisediminis]SIN68986.1 phospholipid-binding lipoprotein MlaA [Halodesulfovibrio marinisediminis DSM 17456]
MRNGFWLILALLILSSQPVYADGEIPLAMTKDTSVTTPVTPLLYSSATLIAENEVPANDEDEFFDDASDYFDDSEYEIEDSATAVSDPFEGWNRVWFDINDWIYIDVAKPAHRAYRVVVPEPVRETFDNAIVNWFGMPRRFVNALLQAKFALAGIEFSRFVVNTAFGFGGMIDIAKNLKPVIPYTGEKEDFGQTLGVWGVPAGPYLVLPFFGASNFRDTAGLIGEAFLPPSLDPVYLNYGVLAAAQFNVLDKRIVVYENIVGTAVEPYIGLRNAYSQLRKAQIEN